MASASVSSTTVPKLARPPAIWAAFAAQGRWKNWVMAGQLVVLALLLVVNLAIARTEPDVVVVDEAGQGHYVARGASSEALLRFIDNERQRPTDLTLLSYTERFVRLAVGINSTTIDEAWTESLSMMARPLQERMAEEAKVQKLLETYRLAQIQTRLAFETVGLVERVGGKALVRATVLRSRAKLFADAPPAEDRLQVELVLLEVPRSRSRPDGLEVVQWKTQPAPAPSPNNTAGQATAPASPGSPP